MNRLYKILALGLMCGAALPQSVHGFHGFGRSFMQRMQDLEREVETLASAVASRAAASYESLPSLDNLFSGRSISTKKTDDGVTLEVELPGFSLEDVGVDVRREQGRVFLDIKADRSEKKADETKQADGEKALSQSRSTFAYSTLISPDLDDSKVKADLKLGILTITIPYKSNKDRSEQSRSIKVTAKGK